MVGNAAAIDVMLLDVQIAGRLHLYVKQAVDSHSRQHVVEEADAGGNLMLAATVQVDGHAHIRLGRLPADRRLSLAHLCASISSTRTNRCSADPNTLVLTSDSLGHGAG